MTVEPKPSQIKLELEERTFNGEKAVVYDTTPSANQLNPFNLDIVAEGNKLILHDPTATKTKAGIHLTEAAAKAIEADKRKEDSRLYFVIGVSENVYTTSKYRPGMWVLIDPDTAVQQSQVHGRHLYIMESYGVVGAVANHTEPEVEELYTKFEA